MRQLCRVMKVFSDGSAMWRERNNRIAKRVYAGECAGSQSVGRLQKRWIDTMECFKKRGLEVRQARRMVHDRSVWRGFVRECMGGFPGG